MSANIPEPTGPTWENPGPFIPRTKVPNVASYVRALVDFIATTNDAVLRLADDGEAQGLTWNEIGELQGFIYYAQNAGAAIWLQKAQQPPPVNSTSDDMRAWCRLMQEWLAVYEFLSEERPRALMKVKFPHGSLSTYVAENEDVLRVATPLVYGRDYMQALASYRESGLTEVTETAPFFARVYARVDPVYDVIDEAWKCMRRMPGTSRPDWQKVADVPSAIAMLDKVIAWCESQEAAATRQQQTARSTDAQPAAVEAPVARAVAAEPETESKAVERMATLPMVAGVDPDEVCWPAKIAERYGLSLTIVNKRLERWRDKHKAGGWAEGWIEAKESRKNEPKYLYRLSAIMPEITKMLETSSKKRASNELSA